MLKILGGAVGLLFAITLFLAFAGAIVALFGGMAGFENARVAGGRSAGLEHLVSLLCFCRLSENFSVCWARRRLPDRLN
jgi:hypothetical protein